MPRLAAGPASGSARRGPVPPSGTWRSSPATCVLFSGGVVTRLVSRCRQTVVMMSSWARRRESPRPRTVHGDTLMPSRSAGGAIVDGYDNGYRTSYRNPTMTCGNVVGGTRFELVTSSVSGKPASH